MPSSSKISRLILERLVSEIGQDAVDERLKPRPPRDVPTPPLLPKVNDYSEGALASRIKLLDEQGVSTSALRESVSCVSENFRGNIESLVGFSQVPIGVMGPLRVNGASAHGDFYVPLATSEGALVASYNRGAYVISQAGGATAVCLTEAVLRAPCFCFENLIECGQFMTHVLSIVDSFQEVVSRTSNHCQFLDFKSVVNGKDLYLMFEFTTGDAAGQNMVTLATSALCEHILASSPVEPARWYLDGNLSGDKKATMSSFLSARGKKVVAEVTIPESIVVKSLHTTPKEMFDYWQVSFIGGLQSGSIGSQGHFANGLTAIFLACGQDVACVSEASIGVTRMAVTANGSLYVSVSLPNVIVGTVGGGTSLPTGRACLEMLDCYGDGKARKFAEICAATVLAGEISIIAAFTAGQFASAHAAFGRK